MRTEIIKCYRCGKNPNLRPYGGLYVAMHEGIGVIAEYKDLCWECFHLVLEQLKQPFLVQHIPQPERQAVKKIKRFIKTL